MKPTKQLGFLLPLFFLTLSACSNENPERLLEGAWKVDSTFQYYNGFQYRQQQDGRDWATYVYDREGLVKEVKFGTYQGYRYRIDERILIYEPVDAGTPIEFQILELTRERLVLQRHKMPIFGGEGQERYEIRYFSKTDMPKIEAQPFGMGE